MSFSRSLLWCCLVLSPSLAYSADAVTPEAARKSLQRGVAFFRERASVHGGYVYQISADLKKWEAEGKTGPDTAWVQPPGTPAVGLTLTQAYQRTRDSACRDAAIAAARCVLQGQYRSGGWNGSIEFAPAERAKHAYRVDAPLPKKRQWNTSSFDDDKSQSAIRFLVTLDQALESREPEIHEAMIFSLDSVLAAQFPNGGWAQVWEAPADRSQPAQRKASFPTDWPRTYPGGDYWIFYTLNDNNISNTIDTLLLAARITGDARYRDAALKAGNFIILAQLPEPQPAWAQQYNFEMHPCWARKFEPPAVSGMESQRLIATLMDLYIESGDRRYLKPIPAALDYLERSQLPDGRMARFYELKSNRPLYMTRNYELTYSDDDLPTHYGFQVDSDLKSLRKRYDDVVGWSDKKVAEKRRHSPKPPRVTADLEQRVAEIIASQDSRGAWVESGRLKYHGKGDDTTRVIRSETFIRNLDTLSLYLQAATSQ